MSGERFNDFTELKLWLWSTEGGPWELMISLCSHTEIWHFILSSDGGSFHIQGATLAADGQEDQGQSSLYHHQNQTPWLFFPCERR